LLCYRQVLPDIQRLLAPRGLAVLELGQGQADAVTALAVQAGLDPVVVRQDLAGIPRALGLRMALPRKNHLAPRRRGVNFM
jgi:release factor glutamine methyltransferase